jgi:adenosylcobinamide kinase / adenosylcobinamide-phosphate guanylyltransferase
MFTLILGGARSGKSRLAQRLAADAGRVAYVATAPRDQDPEMAARIERHRADRPAFWQTVEEPLALASAVHRAAQEADAVIVDCLTLWLSNVFCEQRDAPAAGMEDFLRREVAGISAAAAHRHVLAVSNELGSGTVPEPAITRSFRDMQGLLNQWAAAAADQVILTVAGLPLYLKPASMIHPGPPLLNSQ